MRLTKLKPLALAAAFATFAGMSTEAPAATLLVDDFGQLTGAEGVDVNGTLYDVTFADGTCAGLFGGCDNLADFAFDTETEAGDAAQALLDQVFIDGVLGDFDGIPSLTQGCEAGDLCTVGIPFDLVGSLVLFAGVRNNPLADIDIVNIGLGIGVDNDTTFNERITYALFAETDGEGMPDDPGTDVPAPSALLLFAAGLAGLATVGRRRRERVADPEGCR